MPSFVITEEEDFTALNQPEITATWDYENTITIAVISAVEEYSISDPSTATGQAVVSALAVITYVAEVSTVTSTSTIITVDSGQEIVDSGVVTSVVVITAPELASYVDAQTATSSASTSTSEIVNSGESATVTGVSVLVALDRAQTQDSQVVQSGEVGSGLEATTFSDISPSQGTGVTITVQDLAAFVDQATTSTIALLIAQEGFNTGTFFTDTSACTSLAVPSALDGKAFTDANTVQATAAFATGESYIVSDIVTVTAFQAVSAVDFHTYAPEASTVLSIAVPSTAASATDYLDASAATAITILTAIENLPVVDAGTVTAHAAPSSTDTYASGFAFFDSFVRNPVSSGWGTPSNGGNPWVVINGTAADFSTTGTNGRIFLSNTAGHEIAIAVSAPGGGQSQYNVGQFTQWQWNATNTGTLPVQVGSHLYWVDEANRFYYRILVGQKPTTGSLQLSLDKVIASGTSNGLGGFNVITSSSSLNTYYNLRTEASGLNTSAPTLNARLWLASASEPTTWGFTYTDTSGAYPALNANYGFRANVFAGDTNNPTLKFSQYYGYYL